jgi:hypothetical protein
LDEGNCYLASKHGVKELQHPRLSLKRGSQYVHVSNRR